MKATKEKGRGKDMTVGPQRKDSKRKRNGKKENFEDVVEEEGKKSQEQKEILTGEEVKDEGTKKKRRKMTLNKGDNKEERTSKEEISENSRPIDKKTRSEQNTSEQNKIDEGESRMEIDNQTDEEEDFPEEEESGQFESGNEEEDEPEITCNDEKIAKEMKTGDLKSNQNPKGYTTSHDPIVFSPSLNQTSLSSSFPIQDNLSKVLAQSIKATDESMMEQCLLCTDQNIISSTIQYLPSDMASLFLHQIIVRVDKKPNRADQLLIWIKYILLYHASALSNNEKWISDLEALENITSKRGANYQRLLGLSGRLEMLLAQVDRVRTSGNIYNTEDNSIKQTIVFQDEDTSDDEDNIKNRTLLLRYD